MALVTLHHKDRVVHFAEKPEIKHFHISPTSQLLGRQEHPIGLEWPWVWSLQQFPGKERHPRHRLRERPGRGRAVVAQLGLHPQTGPRPARVTGHHRIFTCLGKYGGRYWR